MRYPTVLLSLVLASALTACSGDSTGPTPVATVSVKPAVLSLIVGQTASLMAETRDAAGATLFGRTIPWSTSDATIATVSSAGVVSAVAVGTATITATSEGKSGSATVTVIPVPVASVTVFPVTLDLVVGQTGDLTATAKDTPGNTLGGRTFTWVSDSPTIATVSTAGVVTALGPGQATITVASESKSASAAVSIRAAIASVEVIPSSATLIVGESIGLTATPKDAVGNALTGRSISWSTSNEGMATVSASGVVIAIAPGTIAITAASEGKSGAAILAVLPVPVASVLVTPGSASVVAGNVVVLTATPRDVSGNPLPGRSIAWISSSAAIAVVSQSGVVTAIAEGSATITASSEGKSGQAAIAVTPAPVATVSVLPGSAVMTVGQTLGLVATLRDVRGNPLTNRTMTWTTSNAGVATVSTDGIVTSVGAGTATITITSEGVSGSAAIAVSGSFSTQATLSNELVVEGSPITYSVDFGRGFSAISAVEFRFIFGTDALDLEECLTWLGGFCNPLAVPQTSRTLRIECAGDPGTCDLFRDGVDTRQITAMRFSGSGVVSVRITSLMVTVLGTPLPAR